MPGCGAVGSVPVCCIADVCGGCLEVAAARPGVAEATGGAVGAGAVFAGAGSAGGRARLCAGANLGPGPGGPGGSERQGRTGPASGFGSGWPHAGCCCTAGACFAEVVPGFVPVPAWVLVGLVAPRLVRRAALTVAGHMLDVAAPLALASQKVAPGFAPVPAWVLVGLVAPSAQEGLVQRASLVFGAVAGHKLDVAARALDVLERWLVWASSGSGGRRLLGGFCGVGSMASS